VLHRTRAASVQGTRLIWGLPKKKGGPNPSLLVDLANLGISKEGQVKLEILYQALNKGHAIVTPPQVQLVTIR